MLSNQSVGQVDRTVGCGDNDGKRDDALGGSCRTCHHFHLRKGPGVRLSVRKRRPRDSEPAPTARGCESPQEIPCRRSVGIEAHPSRCQSNSIRRSRVIRPRGTVRVPPRPALDMR